MAYLKFKEVEEVCIQIGVPLHGGSRAHGYSPLARELGCNAKQIAVWFGLNDHTWGNYKSLFANTCVNARDTLAARHMPAGVAEYDQARADLQMLTLLLASTPERPLRPPHELFDSNLHAEKRMTKYKWSPFERDVKAMVRS